MAQNFDTINSVLTLDKTFDRANGQPLDNTSVWYDMDDAKAYAKTNKAYVGQIISVVDENRTTVFQIVNVQGDLVEVGKKLEWLSF